VGRGATGPAADAARTITKALEPSLIPLARHPDPEIRARALVLVAHANSDEASLAVVGGLEDTNESVQRVALAAVATPRADGAAVPASARAVSAVGKLLATHESWAMRVLAAQAMGRLGHAGAGPDATARLTEAATKDSYALVRQAALEALASFDTTTARSLAARVAGSDPEPRVRDAARAIAAGQPVPSE
jgi:HEAT repeat protein